MLDDYQLLRETLDRLLAGEETIVLISGGETAEGDAQEDGLVLEQFLAHRKLSGRGAKVIRTTQMIEAADHAVLCGDGHNKARLPRRAPRRKGRASRSQW